VMGWQVNSETVIRGSEAHLLAVLLDTQGNPVNISGATQVRIRLKNQDSSYLVKAAAAGFCYGAGPQALWMYSFDLTTDETQALPLGKAQTVDIEILFGSILHHLLLPKYLTVLDLGF